MIQVFMTSTEYYIKSKNKIEQTKQLLHINYKTTLKDQQRCVSKFVCDVYSAVELQNGWNELFA